MAACYGGMAPFKTPAARIRPAMISCEFYCNLQVSAMLACPNNAQKVCSGCSRILLLIAPLRLLHEAIWMRGHTDASSEAIAGFNTSAD